jgi:hypothetical protein
MRNPSVDELQTLRDQNTVLQQSLDTVKNGLVTDNQLAGYLTVTYQELLSTNRWGLVFYTLIWLGLVFVVVRGIITKTTSMSPIANVAILVAFAALPFFALPLEYVLYRAVMYLYHLVRGTPYSAPSNEYLPMLSGVIF